MNDSEFKDKLLKNIWLNYENNLLKVNFDKIKIGILIIYEKHIKIDDLILQIKIKPELQKSQYYDIYYKTILIITYKDQIIINDTNYWHIDEKSFEKTREIYPFILMS